MDYVGRKVREGRGLLTLILWESSDKMHCINSGIFSQKEMQPRPSEACCALQACCSPVHP